MSSIKIENEFKFEIFDLKVEFLAIQARFVNKPLTRNTIGELYQEYDILFKRFDLEEFKFILIKNKEMGIIEFKPMRNIDNWILKGILS